MQILNISEVDNHDSLKRKMYTIFLVVPLGLILMILMGFITLIPTIYNLPLTIVIIFEILTVGVASMMIILKHHNLKRVNWFDVIPPIILIYVAYSYVLLGFITGHLYLGLHMILTGIPFLLTLISTLRKI